MWYGATMRRSVPLPPFQRSVRDAFEHRVRQRLRPPTLREPCAAFGWSSTGTACDHVRALVRKGLLRVAQGRVRRVSRTCLPVTSVSLLIPEDMAPGIPTLAEQVVADRLPAPEGMVRRASRVLLRVRGDSMVGSGLRDGDLVIVAPEVQPARGRIVAVTCVHGVVIGALRVLADGHEACRQWRPPQAAAAPWEKGTTT